MDLMALFLSMGFIFAAGGLALKEDVRSASKGIRIKLDKPLFALGLLALVVALISILYMAN